MEENLPKRNRGKESNDTILFGEKHRKRLLPAFTDLNELLTKGYTLNASLSLVGNHHKLNKRQRTALQRACAPQDRVDRILKNELNAEALKGKKVFIDGFNLLILMESALSGAYIFECADGTYRDLSGVHGSYKRVNKTNEALRLIGEQLKVFEVDEITWVLDEPISNSGRLKGIIQNIGQEHNYNWEVILDKNPDALLVEKNEVGISSDSWILERIPWFNLARVLIHPLNENIELFTFKDVE